jgi:hypothetical protein
MKKMHQIKKTQYSPKFLSPPSYGFLRPKNNTFAFCFRPSQKTNFLLNIWKKSFYSKQRKPHENRTRNGWNMDEKRKLNALKTSRIE